MEFVLPLSPFAQASWVVCLMTAGLLVRAILREPSVWIRPSFAALFSIHLQTQWSSAWFAAKVESLVFDPWPYFFLIQVFPATALLLCLRYWRPEARAAWVGIGGAQKASSWGPIVLLGGIAAGVVIWYLASIPFTETGLYRIVAGDLSRIVLARERSLKLLPSSALKYAYTVLCFTVAPLLSLLLWAKVREQWRQRRWARLGLALVALGGILFVVSFTGARAPAFLLLTTIVYSQWLLRPRLKILMGFSIPLVFFLLVPTALSLSRNVVEWNWANFSYYFVNTLDRIFGRGIMDAIWHAMYVESFGPAGVAGAGNIARLFGVEPVNLFNVIGRLYSPNFIESISANTTFPVAYYACFGFGAYFLSLGLLLTLDGVLLTYRWLTPGLRLACAAALPIASASLAGTYFTSLFITYGFLTIPLVAILLSAWERYRIGESLRKWPGAVTTEQRAWT